MLFALPRDRSRHGAGAARPGGMRLSPAHVVVRVLALALALALSGCVANMPELKETLGVEEKIVPEAYVPPPVLVPPVARAAANTTSALAGHPVKFMSDGTRDPRGLALTYTWDFGDERTGKGPVAVHAYDKPGEYVARLRVVNADGLSDEDTIPVTVALGNRAPTAGFSILDALGEELTSAQCGDKLAFDAASSADADAQPLTYEWDFGDGATAHDRRVVRAYDAPGRYVAKLSVADPAGARAEATRTLRIGCAYEATGALGPADAGASYAFPVASGATSLSLTLTFPPSMGVNDLQLVVKDAKGAEAGRSGGATPPGAQDVQTRTVFLDAVALAGFAAGEWKAEVVKKQGVQVDWALAISEIV